MSETPTLPSPSIIPEIMPFDMSDFFIKDGKTFCKSLSVEIGLTVRVKREWEERGLSFKDIYSAFNNSPERPRNSEHGLFYTVDRRKMLDASLITFRMAEDLVKLDAMRRASVAELLFLGWNTMQVRCFVQSAIFFASATYCKPAKVENHD